MRRRLIFLLALVVLASSCSGSADSPTTSAAVSSPTQPSTGGFDLEELPAEARASNGGGAPRGPEYWAVWNSCAEGNRSAEAAENGGAEAGWFLVDDVLASPGIQLGDYRLESCGDALVVLSRGDGSSPGVVQELASELLAAELNLNIGAETCPAAEEAAVGGNILLAGIGYRGRDVPLDDVDAETVEAVPSFVELLSAYNAGELCV